MKVHVVILLIEADGWYLVATKGSHRNTSTRISPDA
jgi:predicted RNA binding protein YcfA (HicA-like mRNA interferase family)